MAATTGWETYLAGLAVNGAGLCPRLEDPDGILFSDEDINVRITDVGQGGVTSRVYDNDESLSAAIDNPVPNATRMRVISVYSECTIEPLQISSELMCAIMLKYNVHPDFLRVLFSFGEEPHLAEASSSNIAIHSLGSGQNSICYQINYVEENLRDGKDPWSFRHTGIYHHHASDFDLYVLLHPNQHSVVETRLFQILGIESSTVSHHTRPLDFSQGPYQLHLLLLSSFFDNWRWYFQYLGDRFSHENNRAMIVKPENANARSSFRSVQNLRNINDFTLFAKACCKCNLKVVEKLNGSAVTPLKGASDLEVLTTMLRGYVESSDALECRIRNSIDLVGYTLTSYHHLETEKVDKELRDITHELRDMTEAMKNLTQHSADDSTTVKIITYVSAIYLPASLAASLYGMNFFVFDTNAQGLVMGDNFWIFTATWLPLTAITVAVYVLTLWFDARRKGKPSPWQWTELNSQRSTRRAY